MAAQGYEFYLREDKREDKIRILKWLRNVLFIL